MRDLFSTCTYVYMYIHTCCLHLGALITFVAMLPVSGLPLNFYQPGGRREICNFWDRETSMQTCSDSAATCRVEQ